MAWQDTLLASQISYRLYSAPFNVPSTSLSPFSQNSTVLKINSTPVTFINDQIDGYFFGMWLNMQGTLDAQAVNISLMLGSQDVVNTTMLSLFYGGIEGSMNFKPSIKSFDDYNKSYTIAFYPSEPLAVTTLTLSLTPPAANTIEPFTSVNTANLAYSVMVARNVKALVQAPKAAPMPQTEPIRPPLFIAEYLQPDSEPSPAALAGLSV